MTEQNKQAAEVRGEAATLDEHRASLRDAMNALTQALADVKAAYEGGTAVSFDELTAAVDDVTASVGKATGHGSRAPSAPASRAAAEADKK